MVLNVNRHRKELLCADKPRGVPENSSDFFGNLII